MTSDRAGSGLTGSGLDAADESQLAGSFVGERTYTLLGGDRRSYQSVVKGILGGHRRDRVYGRLTCPAAAAAIAKGGYVAHRVFFASEADAVAAGYRPCAACLPRTYADWKARKTDIH